MNNPTAKHIKTLAVIAMMAVADVATAQPTNPCPQWKNPTSFNTGSTSCYWTARVGERCNPSSQSDTTDGYYVMSTCAKSNCSDIIGHDNIVSSSLDSPNNEGEYYGCGYDFMDYNNKRFQIIDYTKAGYDSLTMNTGDTVGMPRIPPGYTSCIRLGDMKCTGGHPSSDKTWKAGSNKGAEALFYTLYVTPSNALLFVNYAIVARRYSHTAYDAGEFLIRVVKEDDTGDEPFWEEKPINDSLWYKVSAPQFTSASLPAGWEAGRTNGSNPSAAWPCTYAYKPWTKVAISLNNFLYSKVRIEMYTSDCIYAADPIYAYICGDYSPMIIGSSGCPSPESDVIDTLSAPQDMLSYQWYAADRGAVAEEYLFTYDYMDTVAFHPISEVMTDSLAFRYNATLSDFVITSGPNAGDTASTQTFMCVMTSAMDPKKPFQSKIYANVENRRPMVDAEFESDCDGTVHLYNKSTVFASSGMQEEATHWVVYSDPTATTPLDTVWGNNTSYQFKATGDYAVKLFCTTEGTANISPCTSAKTFTVHAKVAPPSSFEIEKTVICEGETMHAVASDSVKAVSLGLTMIWVVDGDTVSGTVNDLHKELPVGTHTVTLTTFYSSDSCFSSTSHTVMVMGQPIISLGSDINEICVGDSVRLSADGTIDYTWNSSPNDPLLDTTQHGGVTVHPTQTTTYYLVPAGNSPCKIDIASVRIEVVPTPVPTIRSSSPRVNKEDPRLTLLDVSNDAHSSHWTFSDGGSAEGQRVEHSFTTLDVDSVQVTLQSCNRLNCCDDTTVSFPVEVTTVWFANAFTPDRDENNRFGMETSLTLLSYELFIYNRNGQLVWHSTDLNEKWDGTADGRALPQGSYAYFCRYSYNTDTYHTCQGMVTLIR